MSAEPSLRFTFQSCADLNDIWDSIAANATLWGPADTKRVASAKAFSSVFEQLCNFVRQNPEVGMDRSDLHPGIRSVLFQKYLIFYRVRGEYIEVLRVLGAARDVDLALFA
jgi:toxin ParE1/3/4